MKAVLWVFSAVLFLINPANPLAEDRLSYDPAVVYEAYNANVVSGMSFEKEKTFFSARKLGTLDRKIFKMMERTGKTRQEVINLYQSVSENTAKCRKITLEDKKIKGKAALLIYSQKDLCNPDNLPGPQKVKMVRENGEWKIDDIEIGL